MLPPCCITLTEAKIPSMIWIIHVAFSNGRKTRWQKQQIKNLIEVLSQIWIGHDFRVVGDNFLGSNLHLYYLNGFLQLIEFLQQDILELPVCLFSILLEWKGSSQRCKKRQMKQICLCTIIGLVQVLNHVEYNCYVIGNSKHNEIPAKIYLPKYLYLIMLFRSQKNILL